jgi:hypothetical protein
MKTRIQLSLLEGVDETAATEFIKQQGRALVAALAERSANNLVVWTDKVVLSIHTAASAALHSLPLEPGHTHIILALSPDCELARSLKDEAKEPGGE